MCSHSKVVKHFFLINALRCYKQVLFLESESGNGITPDFSQNDLAGGVTSSNGWDVSVKTAPLDEHYGMSSVLYEKEGAQSESKSSVIRVLKCSSMGLSSFPCCRPCAVPRRPAPEGCLAVKSMF